MITMISLTLGFLPACSLSRVTLAGSLAFESLQMYSGGSITSHVVVVVVVAEVAVLIAVHASNSSSSSELDWD